ncbi:hypothetical protein F0562_036045 [Nyssa sinensis]|uniref:Thioredoxin domain-containing protein n=1 Tax=Nyssa sinensis TaxID=561372 RepID=A0A5J5ADH9_9ASTE|nr:hypothetical protein F0562_036045 [Nyssa sinensis]
MHSLNSHLGWPYIMSCIIIQLQNCVQPFSSPELSYRFFIERERLTQMASEEGQVISCHTLEAWNGELQKGNESKKLVVVDFTASWCGPCRFIAPILADFARKLPHVTFLKVDVDELKTVAEDWAIEAMPTFIFLKEGKIVDKVVGAKKEDLQLTIGKHAAEPATAAS